MFINDQLFYSPRFMLHAQALLEGGGKILELVFTNQFVYLSLAGSAVPLMNR